MEISWTMRRCQYLLRIRHHGRSIATYYCHGIFPPTDLLLPENAPPPHWLIIGDLLGPDLERWTHNHLKTFRNIPSWCRFKDETIEIKKYPFYAKEMTKINMRHSIFKGGGYQGLTYVFLFWKIFAFAVNLRFKWEWPSNKDRTKCFLTC